MAGSHSLNITPVDATLLRMWTAVLEFMGIDYRYMDWELRSRGQFLTRLLVASSLTLSHGLRDAD